jgi:hypothetical protein
MAENICIFNPLTALLLAGVATQLFVLVSDNDNRNNLQLDHIFFDSPRCDGQTQQQIFLSESFFVQALEASTVKFYLRIFFSVADCVTHRLINKI